MHGKGMIHRDIKPGNIFLARGDAGRWQPKLIDFGLTKLDVRASAARLTAPGTVLGTPGYMSPEQMDGADVDVRADVWALSVVAYKAITGALPFGRMTSLAMLAMLRRATPRPLREHGIDDEELWAILERGIAPRAVRWPSARALGRALAGWLWARGTIRDVAGASLHRTWLDDDDLHRLSAPPSRFRVPTARFPAPPSLPILAAALAHEAPSAAPAAPEATLAPAPAPRRAPAPRAHWIAAVIALGIALIVLAGVLLRRWPA
jgi:serine/threonine protein kinase